MADAYAYEQQDSQDMKDQAKHIARCVAKLKGSSRNSQLKVLAGILEQLPQDVEALGPHPAREALLKALHDTAILHSKQKDVRMYAAACFAQLLRIYAPETPYEEQKQLEPVFDLLLWSIEQVQEYQAPTYELAVSVLQSVSQTKSYFLVLDWNSEELLLDWVRALLQCVNAGSSALAGPHALEVLVGIVTEEGASEAVLELLLSHLVPPKSQENQLACQLAQAVLKACESTVKPALQKYLTTLILSPISSNSDLHQHCYTLIYQLYTTVPQVLLPVIPHLTSELHSEDGAKRQEAATLLGRLLSLPGNKLVNEYRDVLDALLRRYCDVQVNMRLVMLEFTSALVAAAGNEELQQQVIVAASERLQDYDDKVRLAAVKAVCQASRQLLVGPTPTPTAPSSPGSGNAGALLSPVDALVGSIGSQELTDAAAADLDLATAADLGCPGPAPAAAAVRDLPFVYDALKLVHVRLRDTKPAVRKAAASHLLSVFRAVVAAGDAPQVSKCCWLVSRIMLCCKSDKELREQLHETLARDGLLGPKAAPAQAAAAWVRVWLAASETEQEAICMMLSARTRVQVGALQLLALRRKQSGRQAGVAVEGIKAALDTACLQLAAQLPQPDRAMEALGQLLAVRDNHAFSVLQAALAPGVAQEAHIKARADALARVGSRSSAAEAVTQLLMYGRPAAWLPNPVMAALLQLVGQDPGGEDAELVQGAYQLLLACSKAAPVLAAGLLPELHQLMLSPDTELQQLGVRMFARCAAQMRKCGSVLTASSNTAMAKLVKQQLLPALKRMARGQPPAASGSGLQDRDEEPGSQGVSSQGAAVQVAPKSSKWAVFGMAACQDSTSTKQELQDIADELVSSLDAGAPDTAAKLQALSVVGRVLPDALARHMETLLRFVTGDYYDAYLDAAAGAADMQAAGSGGGRRRSLGSSMLLTPTSQGTGSLAEGSQDEGAAGLFLKCAALKAFAAACVPDSDAQDAPLQTLRVVVRLSEFLEGLLEPGQEILPQWMSDASPELCGHLRLSAAGALLRLARRHDTRISPSIYCALALMMQDEVEGVRAAFAAKVHKLIRHFQARPSSHQLSAKYAAMLPLAAVDPITANKVKAARMLRTWVHERRTAVQAQMGAAARDVQEGGSTLQDLPEMVVPYGLYILAHHPDFPQEDEEADDPESYTPFQFMLQFMLQPLLVASGSTPAGHMAPALLKMCRALKHTADTSEPPANTQLYSLCDMAGDTIQGLAAAMKLQLSELPHYAGGVTLPSGLYRVLSKADRVGDVKYLPPGYEFVPDPQPAAPLAAPMGAGPTAAATGKGRSKPAGQAAAGGTGRGSKRKAAAAATGTARTCEEEEQEAEGAAPQHKRARGPAAAAGRPCRKGRGKAAAAGSDDEGWQSDEEDAPPSAQKGDQLTRRQQVLRQQQQQLRQRATEPLEGAAGASQDSGEGGGDSQQQQQQQQQPKRQGKQGQRQLTQQQLTFATAAAADASSPAPAKRSRQRVQQQPDTSPVQAAANGHHFGAGSSGGPGGAEHDEDGAAEGSSGESPFAAAAARGQQAEEDEAADGQHMPARKQGRGQQAAAGQQQQRGKQGRSKQGAAASGGDVTMDEDQEQAQPRAGRQKVAAVGGAVPAKAAGARGAGGRATRQRRAA